MYSEFSEIIIKSNQKERNSQRILTNIAMIYLKNLSTLDSQAAAKTRRVFMTVLKSQLDRNHLHQNCD